MRISIIVLSIISFMLLIVLPVMAALRDNTVVLYMPFEEGKGTETKDLSKSGKIGVLGSKDKDLPKWVDGKFGKALEFNGTSNYVEVLDTADFNFANDPGTITLAAWVKVYKTGLDGHGQTRQPIIMKGNSGEWEYALYIYDGGNPGMSVWNNAGSGVSEPSGPPSVMDGEWHAVVGTFDAKAGVKVYVDGKLTVQQAPNANVPGKGRRNVFIAHREDGQFLNAAIDEVRIWNRVLDEKEIAETMKSPLTGLSVDPLNRIAITWGQLKR